jgi:DMSO/TMAO reductase YedYZ molybdopterin-dependent catalytic subunit
MKQIKDPTLMPLPTPPEVLRVGPLKEGAFTSRLHSERVASWLGLWLGITFTTCMLTGLWSHFVQHPPSWFTVPSHPEWIYRVTQGVHVTTGIAAVPLLLAKLFTVYPQLFTWPPAKNLRHATERGTLLLLVGGSVLQLVTGVMNVFQWYAFGFFFTTVHYWSAWVVIGAMTMHVGSKIAIARRGLSRQSLVDDPEPAGHGLSRRGFLTTTGVASGAVVLATVGQTVSPLASLSVLAPRRPKDGPQGIPVNKTARAAGTLEIPGYALAVIGSKVMTLSLEDLQALPQHTVELPITCVEGWSANASWTGVRLMDVLALAGSDGHRPTRVDSHEAHGRYNSSIVTSSHNRNPNTLLALQLNGQQLHPDHGYPLRLIAPNRPGVLQTKWVNRVVVL